MYRVYSRDVISSAKVDYKWKLLAAFVYRSDAEWYIRNAINSVELVYHDYKIMQGGRNIEVYAA